MSNYDKLKSVLKEVFEIDKADLDFGIYRIMNQKREQVMNFIDKKLPQDIKEILDKDIVICNYSDANLTDIGYNLKPTEFIFSVSKRCI